MNARDFLALFAVCFVWGINIVLTRWVIVDGGVSPIFYAAIRFAFIALVLAPFFFRPWPKQLLTLFAISMCIGAAHFGLLFLGLANADASAAAVTGQLGVPFSTLLSMLILGERVGWRRGLGIAMAFVGVLVIAIDPVGFSMSAGLLFIVAAAFIGSVGGILMKRIRPIPSLQMQAWVGLFSFLPLFLISATFEGEGFGLASQTGAFVSGGPLVWAATTFAVLAVSIFGHGMFYVLLKKYEVSLLSPLTLMTPIWGVVLGVWLLSEPFTPQLLIGAVISLAGVLVIALRGNSKHPRAGLSREAASE